MSLNNLGKYFGYRGRSSYKLARGGVVEFGFDEVMAVEPNYENTLVTLKNGTRWLLAGRDYGV